jgi:hypothetical protein
LNGEVDFEFRLTGTGWAWGRISIGGESAEVTASCLGDALGDLLHALCALTQGASEARVSWWEEPGEYRWVFTVAPLDVRLGMQDTRFRVLEFQHMPSVRRRDDEGSLVLEADCPLVELVGAVAAGARRTLEEHGAAGYEAKWNMHPFPGEDLTLLEQWLGRLT